MNGSWWLYWPHRVVKGSRRRGRRASQLYAIYLLRSHA